MICTFFGHRDVPNDIEQKLVAIITDLILTKNVTLFYVGTHGGFDAMVKRALKHLKSKYPHIQYNIVRAYLPTEKDTLDADWHETLYPDGLEKVPKRFAIIERNKWMIEHSDYVVTFVRHSFSNADKFKELAEKKHKHVINIK